jgi:hypothetical protein
LPEFWIRSRSFAPSFVSSAPERRKLSLLLNNVALRLALIDVVALAELLDGWGSLWFAIALAVLLIVPAVVGIPTMVMVALLFEARPPRLHVTVAVPVQLPWVGVAETKLTAAGRESVMMTIVAAEGPLLVTVTV